MKVLYVSKALVVAAYRDKLTALARHVSVQGVMPERWNGTPPEDPTAEGPEVRRWPVYLAGHNHLHLYRRPSGLLRAPAPDLLHVDEEPYSAVTFQLVRRAARVGVPTVFFAWQNLRKRLPPPFGRLQRTVFRQAAGAIAGTGAAASVLRSRGYGGPLTVIPQFGVDPDRFAPSAAARRRMRAELGIGGEEFMVGYGGRLVPEKGVQVLLKAVAGLGDGHLLVLGDGPQRASLERAAVQGGIGARVHFVGHRPSREVPHWLAACDVVALPTVGRRGWSEQFGRILVEAMACGVPVVGSDQGEIPAVVGDAGLLTPAGAPEALRRRLQGLAEDPRRRADLGHRGRRRVLERFTHERIAEATAAFYREVGP